ncbi:MAG: STAS domain-containing protein [Capsulimonadales bacterium]|nr:STAS domain-containing protein [Capsulimonadales bacterium]
MSLNIASRTVESKIHIIDPEGEVDMYTAPLLREALLDAFEGGAQRIVVNLRRVDFIDSTGLGILIGGLRRMREGGGMLRLCEPQPRVSRLLHVTDLDTVLDICMSEQEAIAAG